MRRWDHVRHDRYTRGLGGPDNGIGGDTTTHATCLFFANAVVAFSFGEFTSDARPIYCLSRITMRLHGECGHKRGHITSQYVTVEGIISSMQNRLE